MWWEVGDAVTSTAGQDRSLCVVNTLNATKGKGHRKSTEKTEDVETGEK